MLAKAVFGGEGVQRPIETGRIRRKVYTEGGLRFGGITVRMYGYLKRPYKINDNDHVYKVMIHQAKDGVFVYLYTSIDAVFCSSDHYYQDVADAREAWDLELDARGWIQIEDPLPECQHDSVLPIRVKGRNTGHPQWDQLEILVDGEWVEYRMEP